MWDIELVTLNKMFIWFSHRIWPFGETHVCGQHIWWIFHQHCPVWRMPTRKNLVFSKYLNLMKLKLFKVVITLYSLHPEIVSSLYNAFISALTNIWTIPRYFTSDYWRKGKHFGIEHDLNNIYNERQPAEFYTTIKSESTFSLQKIACQNVAIWELWKFEILLHAKIIIQFYTYLIFCGIVAITPKQHVEQ